MVIRSQLTGTRHTFSSTRHLYLVSQSFRKRRPHYLLPARESCFHRTGSYRKKKKSQPQVSLLLSHPKVWGRHPKFQTVFRSQILLKLGRYN